jgi:hypothetical protein
MLVADQYASKINSLVVTSFVQRAQRKFHAMLANSTLLPLSEKKFTKKVQTFRPALSTLTLAQFT